MTTATVILDVGNVILPFDPLIACRKLEPLCGLSAEEIRRRIYDAKLEWRFEAGQITGAEFTEGCEEQLDVNIGEGRLRMIWSDMFTENEEMSALVRRLKSNGVPLMLLSNTNEWHWAFAVAKFPIISEVSPHVLSYRVGALKPDPAIYQAALNLAGNHGPVVFTDDMQHNVDGAIEAGMDAVLFESVERFSRVLRNRGSPID
jgi:FMN phosphatase YigB (HAD superfamily)